jgi:hypothetical protein
MRSKLSTESLVDVEKRLDRVLELLVAVGRCVPDAVEERPQDVRLQREKAPIEVVLRDDLCLGWIDLRGQAACIEGIPPADRAVDREPLPLLERISHLRAEINATQAPGVGFGTVREAAAQLLDILAAGGEIQRRAQ